MIILAFDEQLTPCVNSASFVMTISALPPTVTGTSNLEGSTRTTVPVGGIFATVIVIRPSEHVPLTTTSDAVISPRLTALAGTATLEHVTEILSAATVGDVLGMSITGVGVVATGVGVGTTNIGVGTGATG